MVRKFYLRGIKTSSKLPPRSYFSEARNLANVQIVARFFFSRGSNFSEDLFLTGSWFSVLTPLAKIRSSLKFGLLHCIKPFHSKHISRGQKNYSSIWAILYKQKGEVCSIPCHAFANKKSILRACAFSPDLEEIILAALSVISAKKNNLFMFLQNISKKNGAYTLQSREIQELPLAILKRSQKS